MKTTSSLTKDYGGFLLPSLVRSLCWLVISLCWLVTYSFGKKNQTRYCQVNAIQITTKLSDKSTLYFTGKHKDLTSRHHYLTSRHSCLKTRLFRNYVDMSDNDVDYSENFVNLSEIKLTSRCQLGINLLH